MRLIAELLADPEFRKLLRENHEKTRKIKAKQHKDEGDEDHVGITGCEAGSGQHPAQAQD